MRKPSNFNVPGWNERAKEFNARYKEAGATGILRAAQEKERSAKKAFRIVNHWTLAKKLLARNVPLHIVKLFIFWYREQEFMVRCGKSLSMTFRC